MSNFSVNYIPTTDEVYGLQNFGVLTVFNYTGFTGGTGFTGPTGPAGNAGPQGATGPGGASSIPGVAGDILYSNGSGIGVTGGLLWNEGTQALDVNSITSNSFLVPSLSLFLYPTPALNTLYLSSNIAITGGTGTTIFNFNTTSPNYANTWGLKCNYSLIGNNTATGATGIIGGYVVATTGSNSYTFCSSLTNSNVGTVNSFILSGNDQNSLGNVVGPNTSVNVIVYFVSKLNSSITTYLSSITSLLTTFNYTWIPTS